jgi:putative transposase
VGLTPIAIESTSRTTDNPRYVTRAPRNLQRKQKSLSRKQKGSNGLTPDALSPWRMNALPTAEAISGTRCLDDWFQAIVIETLRSRLCRRTAALRKRSDAGRHSLQTKVADKAERAGKHFVGLNHRAATSKTCSCCGFKIIALPLSVREWVCPNCGTLHDRDINAACTIKHFGILKLRAGSMHVPVCGGLRSMLAVPSKQKAERCEPLESPRL